MKFNRKALLEVAAFWGVFGCLLGYIASIFYLVVWYSPIYMFAGVFIPLFIAVSYAIYTGFTVENGRDV